MCNCTQNRGIFSGTLLYIFTKALQGKDVYVTTYKFYSYAQYFYFRQSNDNNPKRKNAQWLLTGDIDKPVYFVAKCIDTEFFG